LFIRSDAPPPKGKHPDGMQATLGLDDRPRRIVQDHDVRTPGFERLGGNHTIVGRQNQSVVAKSLLVMSGRGEVVRCERNEEVNLED
jgi:hypothetical protein